MRTQFLAKSSGDDPYKVTFTVDGNDVRVQCGCRAGVQRNLCKHVLGLADGDRSYLYDESQSEKLAELSLKFKALPVAGSIAELKRLRGESDKIKRKIDHLKGTVVSALGIR